VKLLYLSHDISSVGGIQRYSKYEIRALEEVLGPGSLRVCVMYKDGRVAGATGSDTKGRSGTRLAKGLYVWRVVWECLRTRPSLVVCDHVHLAPVARVAAGLIGARYWVNVYAIEVWGELPYLRRHALLKANRVISDCHFTQELLEDRHRILKGRVDILRDCVDCTRFRPTAPRSMGGRTPVILTVSRLVRGRSKGHDRMFKALSILREEGVRAHYVVAGEGGDRARLERMTVELGIAESVTFLGQVPDAELPDLYRATDIFVLTSAFKTCGPGPLEGEGVPLVVIEAQACGRPAITSRLDGSREAVRNRETGILVDPGDTLELTSALRDLILDGDLRLRLGVAAASFARENFSYDAFRDRLGQLVHHPIPSHSDARTNGT
jgi:glycosyltransferase involved in cell wall biosynthesis